MLKIIVVRNKIQESCVSSNGSPLKSIEGLPQKIYKRIVTVLSILNENGITVVTYDNNYLLLSAKDGEYSIDPTPSFLSDEFASEARGAIELLDWYFNPHLSSRDPNRIGGPLVCSDCHQSQPQAVSSDGFCKNPFCPSHAKWAEVIEGYVPPADKLAKVLTCLSITHHQDESSDGALEGQKKPANESINEISQIDAQNEWLEKANDWVQKG